MSEIPDVVGGEPVESDWGNSIRDRSSLRYADEAERNAQEPLALDGRVAYVESPGELTLRTGGSWRSLGFRDEFLPLVGGTMVGTIQMDPGTDINMSDDASQSIRMRTVDLTGGFALTKASATQFDIYAYTLAAPIIRADSAGANNYWRINTMEWTSRDSPVAYAAMGLLNNPAVKLSGLDGGVRTSQFLGMPGSGAYGTNSIGFVESGWGTAINPFIAIGVARDAPKARFRMRYEGTMESEVAITVFCDESLKSNLADADDPSMIDPRAIGALREWRDDPQTLVDGETSVEVVSPLRKGFTAQQVAAALGPLAEGVVLDSELDGNPIKTLDPLALQAVLWRIVGRLVDRIETLEAE